MLGFDDTPRLIEDTGGHRDILTPPLTKDFDFTTSFEASTTNLSYDTRNYPDITLSIIPVNSTVTSPQDEDQFTSAANCKSLQLSHDIYHSAATPGSDAY